MNNPNRQYWRMNMHPDNLGGRAKFTKTMQCLGQGVIGFYQEQSSPPTKAKTGKFGNVVKVGDVVMVMLSNKPFAVVEVTSECRMIDEPKKLGLWCHAYREVKMLSTYLDWQKFVEDETLVHSTGIQRINISGGDAFARVLKQWLKI